MQHILHKYNNKLDSIEYSINIAQKQKKNSIKNKIQVTDLSHV